MTWYAIRTLPGAQQPKREYWAETTALGKDGKPMGRGYRICSGTASEHSAVELALMDAGFTHYMPAEFAVVRNRHRKGAYELRRFALLKGYMFVGDVTDRDWPRLTGDPQIRVPGVQGVVASSNGVPFAISTLDLFRLRMYEQNSRAQAVAKLASLSTSEERKARQERKLAIRNVRKKLFPGRSVKLIWGDKVGHEATVQAWEDQDKVRVILDSLEAATETITVPFEFLKAS